MILHGYFRSSAAYRVRIALNLKGLAYDQRSYHLRKGEQFADAFRALNPAQLVPVLEDGGNVLAQSLAIIEYLDETHPSPPLLPKDAPGRARVRALAQAVACDIHPIDNLRVLVYLEKHMGQDQAARDKWYAHWIEAGFSAIERMLAGGADANPSARNLSRPPGFAGGTQTGKFCHADAPGLADICLVPQVANAGRVKLDMSRYPTIARINAACLALPAFDKARPEKQPDAE